MAVIPISEPDVRVDSLSPCSEYWVIATAKNCTAEVSSPAQLLSLFQPVHFEFLISIGDTSTCRRWVVEDLAKKISDVQNSVSTALEDDISCGMSVPCVANSQFTCGSDPKVVNFL